MGIGNLGKGKRDHRLTLHSLPLMGIGNLCGLVDARVNGASLPLMGIGNWLAPVARLTLTEYSLPLMGIGNGGLSGGGSAGFGSLPLMGIGNVNLINPYPLTNKKLITPHGDRKPGAGQLVERSFVLLITPHGDRKQRLLQEH